MRSDRHWLESHHVDQQMENIADLLEMGESLEHALLRTGMSHANYEKQSTLRKRAVSQ